MIVGHETVVVVTGASRGIGEAAAVEFAKKGARVVLAARDQPRLAAVAERVRDAGGHPMFVLCDVADESDCKKLVYSTTKAFGRIDVLVNNAGVGHYAAVEDLTTEAMDRIFRVNLYGALWCIQAALPHMKARRRGHIVNVSTVISRRSLPYSTAYCMTKFALNALDEGLRLETRRFGIDVTLVSPGLTETEFQRNATAVGRGPPIGNRHGMAPEKVGRALVRAVERRRRRVWLTPAGKLLLFLQTLSPALCDELLSLAYERRVRPAGRAGR